MQSRWREIQERFIDDPKQAVQNAAELVGEAIQRLSEIFDGTRHGLEESWDRGDEVLLSACLYSRRSLLDLP